MTAPLRFHWRLIQGGDLEGTIAPERLSSAVALPELEAQIAFCREAEQSGIDSVLVDISSAKPDSMVLGMALAASTERLKFMVAHRPGLMSPTLFAQQVNTFSTLRFRADYLEHGSRLFPRGAAHLRRQRGARRAL